MQIIHYASVSYGEEKERVSCVKGAHMAVLLKVAAAMPARGVV